MKYKLDPRTIDHGLIDRELWEPFEKSPVKDNDVDVDVDRHIHFSLVRSLMDFLNDPLENQFEHKRMYDVEIFEHNWNWDYEDDGF